MTSDKPTKWWVALFVTVNGKEFMAGGKFFPTRVVAEIEMDRMLRRQAPHLLARAFISEHDA